MLKLFNILCRCSQSTLCGHTMAVTSVDWREETGGGSLLATCSDDRVSISSIHQSQMMLTIYECSGINSIYMLIFLRKRDCLGCAVLLCLVICLTLLASFFLPSHLSLQHDIVHVYLSESSVMVMMQ